jgi:hypothetical protein
VGADAVRFGGWQRLKGEYETQFGIQNSSVTDAVKERLN